MANGSKSITNADIYDRLERLRLEISKRIDDTSRDHKQDINDLRRQFETLEAGRLTRLEAKMNDFEIAQVGKDAVLKQSQAVLSTKFVIIGGIIIAIFNAAMYALFIKLFHQ